MIKTPQPYPKDLILKFVKRTSMLVSLQNNMTMVF
jgi:hypothetical protein